MIKGANERIDFSGEVVVPLDLKNTEKAIDDLAGKGVEGIAICLLWSFKYPRHELQLADLIKQKYPHISYTMSHEIMPILGEYERTVATVIDIYIKKAVNSYLKRLAIELENEEYTKQILIMSSNGGVTSIEDACRRPLQTIDSGPVGGAIASKFYSHAAGLSNAIGTDVGGTTFDVCLVHDGELQLEMESFLNQYKFFCPRVLTRSIGAGGGSIARAEKGALVVGPESAGAIPGPACYGLGNTKPTVTDADVTLGYINPDYFCGGLLKLDKARAEDAIKRLAQELGLSMLDTAKGIFQISSSRMADLIRICTIQKGFDPKEFMLICYGGAGPVHAAAYAEDVGALRSVIPYAGTGFCAVGMLASEMIHSFEDSSPVRSPFSAQSLEQVNTLFRQLEEKTYKQFESEGIPRSEVTITKFGTMRFLTQYHQIEVKFPIEHLNPSDEGMVEKLFRQNYEALYGKGTTLENARCEIINYRTQGTHRPFIPQIHKEPIRSSSDASRAYKNERLAFSLKFNKMVPTRIYDGDKLHYGNIIEGPSIIERWGDTVLIPDDYIASVDEYQNIVIENQERKKE